MDADLSGTTAEAVADVRHRDKLLMLVATGARLAVGLLTFVILARFLGPAPFGLMAAAIAWSGMLNLVADFGLGTSALRDAAGNPARTAAIFGQALAAKAAMTGFATTIAAGVAVALLPAASLPIVALIHLGCVAHGFGDFIVIAARARQRFDIEARMTLAGSAVMLVTLGSVTALTRDPLLAAGAFAASRLAYAVLVAWYLNHAGTGPAVPNWRWPAMVATWRKSRGFALDGILTNLSGQIDVLVFAVVLSAHDMGIYQAGARLVQVIAPIAMTLANVYLPRLSSAAINDDREGFSRNAVRLGIEFTALAIVATLGFTFAGPVVTTLIFGPRYASLQALWPGFAIYVLLKLLGSGQGTRLTARGHVRSRIVAQLACLSLFGFLCFVAVPRLETAPLILAGSALPLLLIYYTRLYLDAQDGWGSQAELIVELLATLTTLAVVVTWLMHVRSF